MSKRKRAYTSLPSQEELDVHHTLIRQRRAEATKEVVLQAHQSRAVKQVLDAFGIEQPRKSSTHTDRSYRLGTAQLALLTSAERDQAKEGSSKKAQIHRRVCVASPTGSGKTIMMMDIINRLWKAGNHSAEPSINGKGQVLIIVPTLEILKQTQKRAQEFLRRWHPDFTVGVHQAQVEAEGDEDLIIATWQTLHAHPARLARILPATLDLVIVDECLHAPSHCISRILRYFNQDVSVVTHGRSSTTAFGLANADECERCSQLDCLKRLPRSEVKLLGFSATPDRSDDLDTSNIFPYRVTAATLKELMDQGRQFSYVDFEGYWTREMELEGPAGSQGRQRTARYFKQLNEAIIRNVRLATNNGRKWVLIFCESLAFQWALEAAFQGQGVPAKSMHGQTSSSDRQKIIRAFETRPGSVLINCGVLVEGADLPSVDCLVIAQPTKSQIRMTQMLGRGARTCARTDKTDCLVLDFTVDHKRHKGMQEFPELMEVMIPVQTWKGHKEDEPVRDVPGKVEKGGGNARTMGGSVQETFKVTGHLALSRDVSERMWRTG